MVDECQKLRGENAALHQKNRMSINIRLLKTNKGACLLCFFMVGEIKTGIFCCWINNFWNFFLLAFEQHSFRF